MKTKLLTFLSVLLVFAGSLTPVRADQNSSLDMVADVVLVRPGCFAATLIGSAFFLVSLPVAATSKSVKKAAHTLVVKPAHATFSRPMGDFTDLQD